MSRATALMKLRRRPGSRHWCPMAREKRSMERQRHGRSGRFYFGTGTVSLLNSDGTSTTIGLMQDITLDDYTVRMVGDPWRVTASDTLMVSYTLSVKDT